MIFLRHLCLLLLVLVAHSQITGCPQLCTNNCYLGPCLGCYQDFTSNAPISSSSCSCPSGMFKTYIGLCQPCPVECMTCSNASRCLTCISGYMLSNSYKCIVNITTENNWVSKMAVNNYTNLMGEGPLTIYNASHGLINITQSNFNSFETICLGLEGTTWFGGYQMFDYTAKVVKTVYNLPPHQWINVRFKTVIIDQWTGNTLVVELNQNLNYQAGVVSSPSTPIWNGTFDVNNRFSDFCGDPTFFDNIAVADAWSAHNSSLAKIQIRMNESDIVYTTAGNPNIFKTYWAMTDAIVRVGSCGRNCQFCSGPSKCTYCHPPYFAVNGICVCDVAHGLGFPTKTGCAPNCVEGEYYNSTAQMCINCFTEYPNCRTCNSTACTSCRLGFFYYTQANGRNLCKNQCPPGFGEVRNSTYTDSDGSVYYRDECKACPANCSTCNHNICLFCDSGFSYFQGNCTQNCPAAHYNNKGVCMPCKTGCLNCTSNTCSLCADGLSVDNTGSCVPTCQSTSTCTTSCTSPCATCYGNNNNKCLSCIAGHILSGHRCVNACEKRQYNNSGLCTNCTYGCDTCSSTTVCTTCIPGFFFVQADSTCVRLCPIGFYPEHVFFSGNNTYENQCVACQTGCNRCVNSTFCLDCQSNYTFFNFSCGSSAPDYYEWTNGSFRRCPSNCIKCRHLICTRCATGWILNQGQCFTSCPAQKFKKTVINYNNGVFGGAYDVCAWKDPLCEVTANDGSGNCSKCSFIFPAAVLLNSTTSPEPQTVCSPYCPQFHTKNLDLTCTLCPDNCRRCLPDLTCLKCLDSHVINHPSLITDVKTTTCVKHFCTDGFFSDSLQCQPCSHGCSQCLLDGRCHHCMSGFTMDNHLKKCYDPNCLVTEFYNSGSCASCVLPCATCTGSGTTCTSCSSTTTTTGSVTTTVVYFLYANTCVVTCPDGTFAHMQSQTCRKCDPRCSLCSSIRNCTACANNFYLLSFYDAAHTPCVPECPLGFWSNSSTVCQRCAPDCKSCYGPSEYQCLTCYPNFYLDDSKCVYFCSAMKYADKKEGHCEWCHPSCAECWGPTRYQCIQCKPGHFIYNHICYNYSCPGATYLAIPSQRLCEPCQFGCQYCSSSQFCYFCTPGYHFYQGWCYLQCPDNLQPVYQRYYQQLLGTICEGCTSEYSSNCVACDQHSCKKCKEGMFLWQESTVMVASGNVYAVTQVLEQCFSQCPQGTFLREEKECVRCSANCASCSRYDSCTQCNSTYNLINGYCTQTCPQGYYRSTSTSACSPCDASCATCSSLSSCTSCPSGKYLKYTPSTQITACVSACSSGFFADPSGWCIKCPSTCIECLNLTHCTSCYSGYSLTNNRCTNSSNTCTSNCGGCEGGVCFQCHDPYLLLSDSSSGTQTCVTQCPSGYFSTAFECKKCNATCASCNNTANNCTTCVAAMFRFKSQCLSSCPVGFFANQTSRVCESCPSHCLNCNNRTCISCQTGYNLHNSSCVSACPNGTFASSSSRMCLNCTGNCSACPDIQNCSTCAPGYFLFNYTCYTQCPQNTYLTSDQHGRQVCKRCVAPCFRCLDQYNCLSCVGGYLLNGTHCQQQCGEGYFLQTTEVSFSNQVSGQNFSMYSQCRPCDQHCLTCSNSSDNCLSCEQDAIFFGGKCVEHCPDSTFNVSNVCINCPSACLRCSNQTSCQVCVSGAVFFNGTCTSACPQGYYARAISNGDLQYNCTPCNTSCSSCNGDSLYDCLSCTSGYYLFNGMCLLSCPNGYYPRNSTSTCSPCPTTCTLCTSFSNCSACQTGYTLSNTRQCSNSESSSCTIPYCLTCYPLATTGGSAMCEQCLSGYSLTLDGQCLATCPSGNYSLNGYCRPCGANCTNCTASGCTICASNYLLYNGICYSRCPNGTINSTSSATCQPDPCLYYNSTNSSACMACSSPYLNYNYSCVLNCPVGTVQSGTQCVACPFNCMYCISPSACTQCKPATYLFQGQCRFHCPVGTYNSSGQCQYCSMPYCLQCSSASNCSACDQIAGAALSNFTCYLNCPTGTYRSTLLGQCLNCTIGCSACVNSSFCTACVSPYHSANGQCLLTCPQGSYLSSGTCLPCSSNCYSCLNGTSCALCLPGYNLYTSGATSSCVSACPTGFYAASVPSTLYSNSNAGICLPCSSPCLTCSTSGTTCTQCQSGFSLTGTTCSTTCSAGYYPIIQIGVGLFGYTFQILVCFPCSPHCATCSSWSTCTSCDPNRNLDPYGNCLGPCAPVQYYDSLVRLCLNCSSLCYECSGPLSTDCLSCNPPLQLYQGSCLTACPFGFYATSTYYCQPCSINCADCEYSANNCTVCQDGAFLQNTTAGMTCAVSCPAGKYLDATLQQCMNCHADCLNCTGSAINQCTACNSSAFLYSGMCVTACPAGTTKVSNFKTQSVDCQTCPSNCLACQFTFTAGLNCSQCAANYYLINGSCLATCPTGTYPSPASTSCIDCGIAGCLTCTFNSSFQVQCTACQNGYLMQTDLQLCVSGCPSGYTQTGPTCVPTPICSMYLYNGFCLSSCPTAMYPSAATTPKTCLNCSQSCLSCGNSSTCTQCSNTSLLFFNSTNSSSYCLTYCPSGFYASQGTCQTCPSTCQTCYLSQGQLSCGSCPATAYLLNGQCLAVCPSGYFAVTQSTGNVCQSCAANCAECSVASTNCTACQNSAYSPSSTPSCSSQTCTSLQYESAPGVCTNCHNSCATCFGGAFYECSTCPSSAFMHQGQCLAACPSGYFASTSPSTCILCPTYCATCTSSSVCTVCQTGYYLNPATSSCVASCSSLSTAAMTYYLSGTSCQPCSAYDVNCVVCGVSYNAATNANAMACSQCTPTKYLYMGVCYSACPLGTYAAVTNNVNICMNCSLSCVTCNTTGCMSCFAGQVLSSSQQCLSTCPSGYFMSTVASVSTCQPCSTHCTTCSSSSVCTTCSQPYVLVSSQCTGCIDGYYYSSSNTCLKCSSECATCTTSSTNCLTCSAGWVVHLNQCLANCPTGYYNNNGVCTACATTNCASCPSDVCNSCASPFVRLVVGTTVTCPSACPSAYFLDSTTNTCHSCSTNCLTCTSATSCSQCNSTVSALFGGYCLSTCPSGYTAVSGVCTACLTNCLACSPTTTCTLCSTGMTNNNDGTCSPATNNCSNGYFYNTATSNCSQCYPTCQTCSGPSVSNCLTCFSGATLSNGVCTASCNSGYFFNSTSTNCQLCSSVYTNCVACNSTHCTQCATNYSLSAGVCSLSCPNGTYLASGQCLSCSAFCLVCTSATTCTQCINSSLILYSNACHTSCPQLTYNNGSTCVPCSQTCLTCTGSATNCGSCVTPYSLSGTSCVASCPNGTFTSNYVCVNCSTNCLLCSSLTNCTQCASSFYQLNGTCRSSCPTGYYTDTASSRCLACLAPCTQCVSRTNCSACQVGYTHNATADTCMNQCPVGQYYNNSQTMCVACSLTNCGVCNSTHCLACASPNYAYYSNGNIAFCLGSCPSGTYPDNTTMTCQPCYNNCALCTNASFCTQCNVNYYILSVVSTINQCVLTCPIGYFAFVDSSGLLAPSCLACSTNCNTCLNATYCSACASHYYRFTTQNVNTATDVSCVNNCPSGYSNPSVISGTGMCSLCGANCLVCLDPVTCTECVSTNYVILNGICTPFNCLNCLNCSEPTNTCYQCASGYYLHNSGCTSHCPNGYYGNVTTGKCELCMANCQLCLNSTGCVQCISSYTFYDVTGTCQNQGYIQFGAAGNMSGFTSNITQIMATTYVATSAGPIAFGALSNTYGMMQTCQFMYLMAGSSDGNPEMVTFLDSLSICSYSNSGNTTANTTSTTGRLLTAVAYTDSFLTTSFPIFIMMGCFICAYICVVLFGKYNQSCCTNFPCLQKYMRYTCRFMERRFKYIYVDLVMWISYIPFLYFSMLQIKGNMWSTGLEIFSSLLAYVIIIIYPLYPVFILRKIFDKSDDRRQNLRNYKAITLKLPIDEEQLAKQPLCASFQCCPREDPNTSMIEMSLSPYIDKVVRPVYNIDVPEYSQFKYFTIPHWRLAYAALKYFRKFLFVVFVAAMPTPAATLGSLVGLSVVYLLYLFILRPKEKLYLILEIILEFLILGFQIFMLIYVTTSGATVSALSIVAHAIGFAMANSTLAIAIILNLMAYYTIFCCIVDCIRHLKASADQDEFRQAKDQIDAEDQKDMDFDDGQYEFPDQGIKVDLEKDLIRQFDGDQQPEQLVGNLDMEKELVRNFGRNVDEYPDTVIPYDLEKKLVHEFGGDHLARDLVKNQNLEKELVRNFGREKDGDYYPETVIPYDLEKKLVRDFDGERHPEDLIKNNDLEKELVRNFGRDHEDEDAPCIPYDLEKKIVRDFGGDRHPEDLVKNNDLEKDLVRNFGRPHDDYDDEPPCIPYDLEKQLVRDFGGQSHPEDLIGNGDLEKELVRNFGRNHDDDIDDEPPCIPYDLEKKIIKDFGGDAHPEDLVKNNDLQKDLVRNFGRPHDDLDDEPPCVPYDLEKKLVRDFGGEAHPEDLVENRDMEKQLVRNFGQNDGFVLPEDMPFAHQGLQKNLLRAYDGEDKQLNPHRRNEPKEVRRRGDDELTEENNLDDIPLDHMDLDEKEFQFNLGGTSYGQKKSMPDNDYSEMPNLRQSKNKGKKDNKKDKKGGYLEPADNTEEQMAFSGLSSDSPQAEGLVKDKTDKHRRQVGTNKVLVSKGSMREPTQNYKRPMKQTSKGEEESMEALFFNPVKEQFVEDVDTNARIKQVNEPAKKDKLRATDGFGDFEQIVEPRKSAKVLPKKPVHLPKPSKNILFGEEGFDEFAKVPAQDEPSKRKKTENKYYKGSDDEGQQVIPRDKTNKYRRGARESQEAKKHDKKKFAEDEPIQQIKRQGQYEHLFEGQSNESIVVGEVRPPKKEETYEDVVNRNKQQVFRPDPSKRKLINLDSGQFEQVEYEDKPKGERYNEKNQDSGLFTSSREQLGDSKIVRKRRSSSHLKLNKKSGALGSKEELELEDESGVSRDSRRSKIIQKKVKSGTLNIDDKSAGEEELDEIKF